MSSRKRTHDADEHFQKRKKENKENHPLSACGKYQKQQIRLRK